MISRCSVSRFSILLLLVALTRCVRGESVHCYINITQRFHDNQPLLLRHNTSEFLYPRIYSPSIFEMSASKSEIRVACPSDLLVANTETLGIGAAFLKCHGGSNFGVAGSQVATPFDKISCSKPYFPITRKRNNCPIGKCIQIGFLLNLFTFLPVIDVIAYDTENKAPLWAHARIVPVIESRQRGVTFNPSRERGTATEYRMGILFQNATIEMSDIFQREYQRRRFRSIFDDGIEWFIGDDLIVDENRYFVEGQLISRNDFFYKSQQQSTYFYENVVPMWKSVHEGNWRHVSGIVRKLASETMAELDVWSGGLGVLTLHGLSGIQRKVYLARDTSGRSVIPAPKILFKYVYDRKANRGLVFLVVNHPNLEKISTDYVICKRQHVCENMYPQFNHLDKGYTYCCTLDGFLETAKSIGLPTFSGATSIGS